MGEEPQGSTQDDPGHGCYEGSDSNDHRDENEEGHAEVDHSQFDGLGRQREEAEENDDHHQETGKEEQPRAAGPIVLPGIEVLFLKTLQQHRIGQVLGCL